MSNIHTLAGGAKAKYIGLGQRLGSAREIELEDALRSSIKSNSELTNEYRDLQDIYSKREEAFRHTSSDNNDKISQLNAENKSFKSNIKTLKRELTLARKASSVDKVKILSLETKIRDLEGKLEDIDLERTYHDLDVMGGVIEEPAQISSSDPKEIDSLRLELERVKEDRDSKEYTIECMEKGIEATNNIFKREIDSRSSERLKLMEENRSLRDQLASKKNNEVDRPLPPTNNSLQLGLKGTLPTPDPTISIGGAEAVPLPATTPIIATSLISPMVTYSILTLVLIAIIWFMVRKWWNSRKKSNQYFTYRNYINRDQKSDHYYLNS
ncbi:unnamed protein product [Rhizophagus irregularis]|nr:unnamed protein product [Rhizophagus irregularis]